MEICFIVIFLKDYYLAIKLIKSNIKHYIIDEYLIIFAKFMA